MDLLAILSTGAASLSAQRAAAAVASHNLQNANTPGYARQRANLEAVVPADYVGGGFIGRGVRLASVTQTRDRFLEAQVPGSLGNASRSAAEADALEGVSALDPQAAGDLTDALSGYYAALRSLSQDAGNPQLRQAAVSSAKGLALAFRRTAGSLEQARTGLDARIRGQAAEANQLAVQVSRLNGDIRAARASGAEPNDLLDARQSALDRLAELVGAVPVPDANGDVNVTLGGGAAIVTGSLAGSLGVVADPGNGGHLAVRVTLPGSTSAASLPSAALGGAIGGALDARDGALATAASRVDQLAFDVAGAANAVHRAGYGLDGATGRDLFDAGAAAPGAASRFAVAAAVAADPRALAAAGSAAALPGDASSLQALVATESQGLTGGLSAAAALSDLTSQFGAASQRARAAADQDASLRDHLASMRASVSGVSIDEELIEMQKAQRAYEAIAKVIQTSSEMLSTLMDLR
jgi:flagellar hook-associated protein 1 FlgK